MSKITLEEVVTLNKRLGNIISRQSALFQEQLDYALKEARVEALRSARQDYRFCGQWPEEILSDMIKELEEES